MDKKFIDELYSIYEAKDRAQFDVEYKTKDAKVYYIIVAILATLIITVLGRGAL